MDNYYVCDDRNVLENLQAIRNMTDDEFEEYLIKTEQKKSDKTIYIDDRPVDVKIKEFEQKNGELKPLTDAEKKEYGI